MNDLKPYRHGDEGEGSTHYACSEMLNKNSGATMCCECSGHACTPPISSDPHKIGIHGAVGFMTQQGRVCAECNEKIEEPVKVTDSPPLEDCACGGDPTFTSHSDYECHNDGFGVASTEVQKTMLSGDWEERWEVRLHNIRVGACGCQNCIPSQELFQFIKELLVQQRKELVKRIEEKYYGANNPKVKDIIQELLGN